MRVFTVLAGTEMIWRPPDRLLVIVDEVDNFRCAGESWSGQSCRTDARWPLQHGRLRIVGGVLDELGHLVVELLGRAAAQQRTTLLRAIATATWSLRAAFEALGLPPHVDEHLATVSSARGPHR